MAYGSGSLSLGFSASGSTFDYLTVGETVTLNYEIAVYDGDGGTTTRPLSVVVTGVPDDPTDARNDAFATDEVTVLTGSVLDDNGSGPDSGTVRVISAVNGNVAAVDQPFAIASGALLTLDADGTFAYDPNGVFESLGDGVFLQDCFNYTLSGSSGNDETAFVVVTIEGVDNNDVLTCSPFNDTLDGGLLNDEIICVRGADDDLLIGQSGIDTFVFDVGWGQDRISGYGNVASVQPRADEVIDMSNLGITFADLTIEIFGSGSRIFITADRAVDKAIEVLFRSTAEITARYFFFG